MASMSFDMVVKLCGSPEGGLVEEAMAEKVVEVYFMLELCSPPRRQLAFVSLWPCVYSRI